ncbi:sulfurtransferase [Microbulbifer yueqingensis]|uniref:sulfurtransferase n=1 Tax=Microbulbifer yueqingensis TaxID=658219 RepID=UPI001FDF4468|nr:sulfurtransferase [Microbulbifer yueqingensis]
MIEPADLAGLLHAPNVVILDCRYDLSRPLAGEEQFAEAHIPGAHYASLHRDLSAPVQEFGGRHPLPSPAQFQSYARRIGINSDSHVITYDDQRLAFAARAWWLLRYFGHRQVSILNGGYRAWRDAGLAVEAGSPQTVPPTGNFIASPDPGAIAEHKEISSGLGQHEWQLVDARDPARFQGIEEPMDPVAGHIPSAINKPWQEITDSSGKVKSQPELRDHWQDVGPGKPLICYCGSGVTACVNLLSLHLIGRDDVRLYPGSWSDWCAHSLYPTPHGAS